MSVTSKLLQKFERAMRSRTQDIRDSGVPALLVLIALSTTVTICLLLYCHSLYYPQTMEGHNLNNNLEVNWKTMDGEEITIIDSLDFDDRKLDERDQIIKRVKEGDKRIELARAKNIMFKDSKYRKKINRNGAKVNMEVTSAKDPELDEYVDSNKVITTERKLTQNNGKINKVDSKVTKVNPEEVVTVAVTEETNQELKVNTVKVMEANPEKVNSKSTEANPEQVNSKVTEANSEVNSKATEVNPEEVNTVETDQQLKANAFSTGLMQTDPKLWELIRKKHLTAPSNQPYNLSEGDSWSGFSSMIFNLFNGKKKGIFIEAGAFDGEKVSNSLSLERLGWDGILVECNPILLTKLREKNRKAWIIDACLSLTNTSQTLNFTTPVDWPASARLGKPMNDQEMKEMGIDWMKNKTWLEYQLPSFPLYSIIKAVEEFNLIKAIDFLSLDVEGAEIAVLKNYPFEKMPIKVMLVEMFQYTNEEKADLRQFLSTKGYDLIREMTQDDLYALKSLKLH